jgi:chemotaxis signal transduction protein
MTRPSINWGNVHARLRASEIALQEALSATPQRIEAAYRERAARLANQLRQLKPASPGTPALIFRLSGERYAIQLKDVAEVLPCVRCMSVPGAPAEFLGVISVRGELRSVLNLSAALGVSRNDRSGDGLVLMVRHQGQGIGLNVDAIEEVRNLQLDVMTGFNQGRFVKGMVSGTLMLLDAEKLLAEVVSKEESSNIC